MTEKTSALNADGLKNTMVKLQSKEETRDELNSIYNDSDKLEAEIKKRKKGQIIFASVLSVVLLIGAISIFSAEEWLSKIIGIAAVFTSGRLLIPLIKGYIAFSNDPKKVLEQETNNKLNVRSYIKPTCTSCSAENEICIDRWSYQCENCKTNHNVELAQMVLNNIGAQKFNSELAGINRQDGKAVNTRLLNTIKNQKDIFYHECKCGTKKDFAESQWYYVCSNCSKENILEGTLLELI